MSSNRTITTKDPTGLTVQNTHHPNPVLLRSYNSPKSRALNVLQGDPKLPDIPAKRGKAGERHVGGDKFAM